MHPLEVHLVLGFHLLERPGKHLHQLHYIHLLRKLLLKRRVAGPERGLLRR